MHNKLGLFDPNIGYHHSHSLWHTWCNFRAGSDRIFKCLDRAMILNQSFFSFNSSSFLVKPLVDVTLLDHFPISFRIEWETRQPRTCKMQFF